MNKGYLQASTCKESDECLTPRYGILPIIPYLRARGYKNIWCLFDKLDSQYVRILKANEFVVIATHISVKGEDFFEMKTPKNIDCIVSNPPFSCKTKVLKKLYELNIPFAILLPQNALQAVNRVPLYIENGLEYLGFDRRINFYTRRELDAWKGSVSFANGYFCKNVLPEKLIFEKLTPIQENYYEH